MRPAGHLEPPIRLVVVDLGGTSVDDAAAYDAAILEALDLVGVEAADRTEQLRAVAGRAPAEQFAELLGDAALARLATVRFEAAYARLIRQGAVRAIPEAVEALVRLRRDGARLALVSSLGAKVVEATMAALGWSTLVDLAVTPSTAGVAGALRGAPAPDLVLHALTRTGVDDVRSIAVVGDTAADLLAGWRAGAAVVAGVLTGAHGFEQFATVPHTHILGSLVGFPALVRSASRETVRGWTAGTSRPVLQPVTPAVARATG